MSDWLCIDEDTPELEAYITEHVQEIVEEALRMAETLVTRDDGDLARLRFKRRVAAVVEAAIRRRIEEAREESRPRIVPSPAIH
jgi:hypothetical protein